MTKAEKVEAEYISGALTSYHFPEYEVTVEAEDITEARKKLSILLKERNGKRKNG